MVAAARHRPGSRAAQARACGPPPDQPTVTNSAMPRASRTAARSAAAAATRRPGSGVEPPYPGRAYSTRRRPRSAAAAAIAGAGISPAGVPLCRTTVSPSGGPLARASSCRPSAAWTVTFSAVIGGLYGYRHGSAAGHPPAGPGGAPWAATTVAPATESRGPRVIGGSRGRPSGHCRSVAVQPLHTEVGAVAERRHRDLGASAGVHHDDLGGVGAAEIRAVHLGVAEVNRAEVGKRQHAAGRGGRLGDHLGRGPRRAAEGLVDRVRPAPGDVLQHQGEVAAAVEGDRTGEVVAWAYRVAEVHRECREHLIPAEIPGRPIAAVHFSSGLLHGAAV